MWPTTIKESSVGEEEAESNTWALRLHHVFFIYLDLHMA